MSVKPEPNRKHYIEILRRMTPSERLEKLFEITEYARELFKAGLRRRYPELSSVGFHELYLAGIRRCHNENY